MRLDKERPSDNVEDRRTPVNARGAPDLPRSGSGGGGRSITLGVRIGLGWRSLLLLTVALAAFKLIFGIDLSRIVDDVAGWLPPKSTQTPIGLPDATTDVSDAGVVGGGTADSDVRGAVGKDFVVRVLG